MLNEESLKKREQTFVSTARCDIRTAASLLSFFQKTHSVQTKSKLLRLSLEALAELLVKKGLTKDYTRLEAFELLTSKNLLTGQERNKRTRFEALQTEQLSETTNDLLTAKRVNVQDEEVQQASEILKNLMRGTNND